MPEWGIVGTYIIVTCECGKVLSFDKQDLDNFINRTCRHCGRLISAGIDITISPPRKNDGITQHEYDLRKANPYDLNDVAKLMRKEK
jgi:hypothetical protein